MISSTDNNYSLSETLRYGSCDFGGLKPKYCAVESLIRKMNAVHNLLPVVISESSKTFILLTQWFQHASDPIVLILDNYPFKLQYINNIWMHNFIFLLQKYDIQIKVPQQYTRKLQKFKDSCIMDIIMTIEVWEINFSEKNDLFIKLSSLVLFTSCLLCVCNNNININNNNIIITPIIRVIIE